MAKKKKKKVRVREAKPGDVNLFRKMWLEYLTEQHEKGAHVLPTEKNLEVFTKIFALYVSGEVPGTVLFVAEDAVLMWGSTGDDTFETDLGSTATGWGTYVKPEARGKGISKKIREAGYEKLRELGFNVLFGTGIIGDETSLASAFDHGWSKDSIVGLYHLSKQE